MELTARGRVHFLMDALEATLQNCVEGSLSPLDAFDWALRIEAIFRLFKWHQNRPRRRIIGHQSYTADTVRKLVRHDKYQADTLRTLISRDDPLRFGWIHDDSDPK